jgi:predicted adenylyl cyclase CyaB
MASNIEMKSSLKDRSATEAVAVRLSETGGETIRQEDIFFHCRGARLNLRVLGSDRGELIRYERADAAEARCSRYMIAPTTEPQALKEILAKTIGIVGVVKKTRTLYRIGQTRVHIDEVEGLGTFLELEVVLRQGQSEIEGKAVAESLMSQFGIEQQQLISGAYVDLLAHGNNGRAAHR